MPKALTASLPTFDGKSEKVKLFEDLFRNIIKMYPHLTELQKINYFHSLLRGYALQAFSNIEDAKKDSLEETMTIFKRRFGDYLSMLRMGRIQIQPLHAETTRIFGRTPKDRKRGFRIRSPTIHRQSYLCQDARSR